MTAIAYARARLVYVDMGRFLTADAHWKQKFTLVRSTYDR